jgi:hypothetical protein
MTPGGSDRRSLAWLAGALLLCAIPARHWLAVLRHGDIRAPASPVDRTSVERGRQWQFLEACQALVPPGATVSVVARDGEIEMALFMMAIGLFPEHAVVPHTYYGQPAPREYQRADWVLAYGPDPPALEGADLAARVAGGAVYRRRLAP